MSNMRAISFRWQSWIPRPGRPGLRASELPLRAELFSIEQLSRHAKALAAQHQTVIERGPNHLLARLDENEEVLRSFNRDTVAVDRKRQVTPAAEWLLDNFYLIEEQIQMARRHLPRNYIYSIMDDEWPAILAKLDQP